LVVAQFDAGGSYQTVTTMQGSVPSLGFPAAAATTVSILMMVAEPRLSSQALICSSIALALLLVKILTFIGLGILHPHVAFWPSAAAIAAISGFMK
jgi:hypothetical protein